MRNCFYWIKIEDNYITDKVCLSKDAAPKEEGWHQLRNNSDIYYLGVFSERKEARGNDREIKVKIMPDGAVIFLKMRRGFKRKSNKKN